MKAVAGLKCRGLIFPLVIMVIALAGGKELGHGIYIKGKAMLAQGMLQSAWEKTLATGQIHKAWPWADSWPVARLQVKRLHIDLLILKGVSGEALAFGPGQMDGLARPGDRGVALLAGHRDTHFAFLKNLLPGDKIQIETEDGNSSTFVVFNHQIVDARRTFIRNDRTAASLILSTCYPFDSLLPGGPLRYLVYAEKI